eukprot:13190480-Alexandrium_andersonii.AAC.1
MPCWRGRAPCSVESLARLEQWARGGAAEELARAVDARRKAWREAMRASACADWAAAARWLKGPREQPPVAFLRPDGAYAAAPEEVHEIVRREWPTVFRRYDAVAPPSVEHFLQ